MTTTTEQRGFTGVYDAAGHRADVIALLQGGKTSEQLADEHLRTKGLLNDPWYVLQSAWEKVA